MQTNLKNKRILLIIPFFFGYETVIKNEYQRQGAIVDMFNERPVTSAFGRAVLKTMPFVLFGKIYSYYKEKMSVYSGYDYVLVVGCDSITKRALRLIKRQNPNAKMCLHLMDSIKNIKHIKAKFPFFDYCSSFDREDCERNSFLKFRPLFFSDCFSECSNEKVTIKYDLCFCGTAHSDRYFIVRKIEDSIQGKRSFFKHLYLQAPFMFYFFKFFGKGFLNSKKSDFSFKKMSLSDVSLVERESAVVLDIQHPKQSGLTMRTIELLGSKKKMITTNQDVVNYDFYNPNNILIINRKKPVIDDSFFERQYVVLDEEIYTKYSVKKWVLDVLGE